MTDVRPCLLHQTAQDAAPGHNACQRCADRLAGNLLDLVKTYYELTSIAELTPTGSGDNSGGARPVPGPRSPAVDALLVHTDPRSVTAPGQPPAALASITEWARSVREDRSADTPPDQMRATVPAGRATMAREYRTLRFHWDYVLTQDWLPAFADEVQAILNALRIVRRLNAPVMRIGTCPKAILTLVLDGEQIPLLCGAQLRVRTDATTIRCRNCGSEWTRATWHHLGDGLTDYARLADELGVVVGTLRYWASKDDWTEYGTRGRRLILRTQALDSYRKRRGHLPLEQAG